jgi:putative ABC transport system permease protein
MALASILRIYRARLRARAIVGQELLAVLGIAIGVALLFASQVASTSLDGSVAQLSRQLVGNMDLQLQARSPQGFPRSMLAGVRAIPGVRQALPVLEAQADVIGPRGRESVDLIGSGPQFAHAGGPLLRRFSARQLSEQRALALPAPVAQAIGAGTLVPIEVQVGTHVSTTLLGATLQEGDIGPLVHSPVAIAPVAYAEQLTGTQGRITRIFVKTAPGERARVRAALTRLVAGGAINVEPAQFDSTLFSQASAPASDAADLFSAISALIGFMFAFNALLITARMRGNMIGELRRHGATRAATIQTLLFDALVLGVLGCGLGLLLGELLSRWLFHPQPGYLTYAFPVGSQRIVSWQSIAIAAGAGMLAACVGVLVPLRGALGRPLRLAGGGESGGGRWRSSVPRIAAGIACLTFTTAILAFDPAAALAGSAALILALLALLPLLFDACIAAFSAMQRPLHSAAARLAAIELRTPATRTRSLAIAATGAVAVFGSVAVNGAHSNLQRGLDEVASAMNRTADVWISAAGSANTLGTTPFSSAAAGRLSRLPDVRALGIYRGGFLNIGDRRVWVIAPPANSPTQVPASQLVSGRPALVQARLRAGGWAVISQAIAAERNLHVGQRIELPAPRPIALRIAGLGTNVGWPPGALILSSADYARAWGSTDASAFEIALRPGVSPAVGAAAIRAALGPHSGLLVQTGAQREAQWRASSRQGLSRLSMIALLVLLAAVLATAGATAALIWQRRPQIAYLKRQGYRRAVLWRALLYESALLLLAGCSIGAAFGLYGQVLLSHALASVTGFPVVTSIGPLIALWSVAVVSLAAVSIVAAPGYIAAREAPSVNPG